MDISAVSWTLENNLFCERREADQKGCWLATIPAPYVFNPVVFEVIQKTIKRDLATLWYGKIESPKEKSTYAKRKLWAELIADKNVKESIGNGGISISDIYWGYFNLGGREEF